MQFQDYDKTTFSDTQHAMKESQSAKIVAVRRNDVASLECHAHLDTKVRLFTQPSSS